MKDKVANQLVKYLEARGVEYVFGLCGHTNIAVLSAIEKSKITFVNTRHEQVAAHAADGYARAKNQTAVVLSHLGPGLTNAATGVANASLDSVPMVVIAGDIPSHYYGKHPHQEVNMHADAAQFEIYRPFVKRAWRVERPDLFPEILEKAFSLAESGRPGPVLVDVADGYLLGRCGRDAVRAACVTTPRNCRGPRSMRTPQRRSSRPSARPSAPCFM
jgi:acetolactate synthase-1/2/3 large subunit